MVAKPRLRVESRAAKGMGSIRRRPNGRYEGRVDLGVGPDGKRIRRSVSGATRAEVAAAMQALRSDGAVRPRSKTITVGDCLDAHADRLDARVAAGSLAASTRDRDYGCAAARLEPLRDMRVGDVTPAWLQGWVAGLTGSSSLRRKTWDYFRRALATGRRDGLVSGPDPFSEVDGPPASKRDSDARFASADDVQVLLAGAREPWRTLWLVMAYTGLRPGEAVRLQWGDVDFDAGVLRVRRAATKTDAGARTVWMVPAVAEALQVLPSRSGGGLVFPGERRGGVVDRGWLRREFNRSAPAGLTPHGLRHGVATRLLESGVPVHVVAGVLGHSTPAVTLRSYAHSVAAGERAALQRLADGDSA